MRRYGKRRVWVRGKVATSLTESALASVFNPLPKRPDLDTDPEDPMSDPAELTRWKADRLAALTAPDGWLNLTDRLDIPPGPQTLGSAPDNALILSRGPAHLGTLLPGFAFRHGSTLQPFVTLGGYPQLQVPPFLLEIHTVDDQPALRVRDLTLPRHAALSYFPHDPTWIIRARWETLATPQSQSIDQKGGKPPPSP